MHRRRRFVSLHIPWPRIPRLVLVVLLGWWFPAPTARAVILHGSGDPAFNTTAPTGNLTDSGWTLQGQWGAFLGTPIASNLFVTAKHVGGDVGGVFNFRGTNFTVIGAYADPQSDLRIFKVCGIFPAYAGLYPGSNENGRSLVVFGRGTRRGAEIMGAGLIGMEPKGWAWGDPDGVMRWGENVISGTVAAGPGLGELLAAEFNASGGANEAHLSTGDSGGAVFIRDAGVWKLAGINYAVDGPFNTNSTGPGFYGAIYDSGGLYQTNGVLGVWEPIPDTPIDVPTQFFATRISSNLAWINSIIAAQAVASYPPVLESTASLGQSFLPHPGYTVDELAKTITLAKPTDNLFLRIRGCLAYEFISEEHQTGFWILHYGP